MFYAKTIIVPRDVSEDDPYIVEIPLREKWIEDIWVGFPPGCSFKVKVRIYYGIRRWFPEQKGEWIVGDDVFIPLKTIVKLAEKQESIKVYICSPGTQHVHSIVIYIWTSEEEPSPIGVAMQKLVRIFKEAFGIE